MTPTPSLYELVAARKVAFLVTFFTIFTLSYGLLALVDFLPEKPGTTTVTPAPVAVATSTVATTSVTKPVATSLPITLEIPSLKRVLPVANPTSPDIPVLDAALLKGVARHPESAKLGEEGNVLIFGHSSYLPNVMNKNYQDFNGIQNLKFGEIIVVKSATMQYTYRVDKVYLSKASNFTVDTAVSGEHLTLVTCDSFGAKQDRFIVEATLQSKKAL
jgi:LPXTG-site transpeptidase (sortase) family protein